ncbi:MAG: protein-L-isoaspartate O-methyltransferase, partial [Bacteroidales bacterium]
CFYGDGYAGLPAYQPFDKVIVTCGAPYIPEALVAQLKVGGILVVPIGDDQQTMVRVKKESESEISVSEHGNFRFVPMLEEKAKG